MTRSHHARTPSWILTAMVTLAGWWGTTIAPRDVFAGLPPVARITTDLTAGTVPLTVGLDAGNSVDPDGVITAYDWNFGDRTAHGTDVRVTHTYEIPGIFSVKLTTTDNEGQTATITTVIRVRGSSADTPLSMAAAQPVPAATPAVEPPAITPPGGAFTEPTTVALSTATLGAVVYYTLDGSVPADAAEGSSRLYTGPFTLANGVTTINALAVLAQAASPVTAATFTVAAPTMAVPVIEPLGGAFTGSVGMRMRSMTPDSRIRYTLDGTEPTHTSMLYTGAVNLIQSVLVQARAFREGFEPSEIAAAAFTITPQQVEPPLMTPLGGTFTGETIVMLTSATPGAQLRYTLDGTEPTGTSLLYRPPLTLTSSATLRARALFADFEPSGVTSATFTAQTPMVAVPVITPPGGAFTGPVRISLKTATKSAVVRYTLDGTEPTHTSALYTTRLNLRQSATLKAKGFRDGHRPSDTTSASLTITAPTAAAPGIQSHPAKPQQTGDDPSDLAVAAVVVTPKTARPIIETPEGMNVMPLKVTIRSTEDNTRIRYTLDGTNPTERSPRYTAPIALTIGAVVKARAFRVGAMPSDVATAVFKKANEQSSNMPQTPHPAPAPHHPPA